ncbi:MAG TPA: TIGR01777 family oxidoreductase [Acidimicrobiales bacterium]|nr:TIGR01777 family oxidoreductase [Acidimicrobiales bacterium]
MGLVYRSVVPHPVNDVFNWYSRPGALARLAPPWLGLRVVEEPSSLRNGRAMYVLLGGKHLVSRYQPGGYEAPHYFVNEMARWRHTHVLAEGEEGTVVEDRVETPLPASVLLQSFAYRHRQLGDDLASHARPGPADRTPMTVAMTGASGLIGSALSAFLTSGGHRVIRLVRRAPRSGDERLWAPGRPSPALLEGVDALVHLAGASIAGRFSASHKRQIWGTRVGPTRLLAEVASRSGGNGGQLRCFVTASAIGFYGSERDDVVTERAIRGEGYLAELVEQWEAACLPAAVAGTRTVHVRTGIVQSPRGGVLGLLYPVFLAGLGGRLGTGRQWMSWVGVDDLVDIYYRALTDSSLSGPVNAVSPAPVTNEEYSAVLARVLRRPSVFRVPSFAIDLALGREGRRELAGASQRVRPAVLEAAGHVWRHPTLEEALRHNLGRWR